MVEVLKGRWYPEMPPMLPGETDDQYTDRLTGADGTNRRPYDHSRNRQCSIGWHEECSDPQGLRCECPCHEESSGGAGLAGAGAALDPTLPEQVGQLLDRGATAEAVLLLARELEALRAEMPLPAPPAESRSEIMKGPR